MSELIVVGVDGFAEAATALASSAQRVVKETVDLLVVGHRGRGALASTVLGSVGLTCVLHAHCPVTIVRPARVPEEVPFIARATAASAV